MWKKGKRPLRKLFLKLLIILWIEIYLYYNYIDKLFPWTALHNSSLICSNTDLVILNINWNFVNGQIYTGGFICVQVLYWPNMDIQSQSLIYFKRTSSAVSFQNQAEKKKAVSHSKQNPYLVGVRYVKTNKQTKRSDHLACN